MLTLVEIIEMVPLQRSVAGIFAAYVLRCVLRRILKRKVGVILLLNFVCDMSQEFPSIEPQIFRPQIIEVIKIGVVSKSAAISLPRLSGFASFNVNIGIIIASAKMA